MHHRRSSGVVLLQRPDLDLPARPFGEALHRGERGLDRRDRAHPVQVRRLADLLAVGTTAAALRRVDDEADLAVGDQVDGGERRRPR